MGIREQLRNPAVGGGIAVAFLLLAVFIMASSGGSGGGADAPSLQFYHDLNTGKLFESPAGNLLPVDAPSGALQGGSPSDIGGKAGVRAHVYSCGECTESEVLVSYLEYYPESVWSLLDNGDREDRRKAENTRMISKPDGQWVAANSEEAKAIDNDAKCPSPKPCYPADMQ